MKLTNQTIKTTIDNLKSVFVDIHIATHSAGANSVEIRYNTNFKIFTIKNNGVEYYATNKKRAIELFYQELYRTA